MVPESDDTTDRQLPSEQNKEQQEKELPEEKVTKEDRRREENGHATGEKGTVYTDGESGRKKEKQEKRKL